MSLKGSSEVYQVKKVNEAHTLLEELWGGC